MLYYFQHPTTHYSDPINQPTGIYSANSNQIACGHPTLKDEIFVTLCVPDVINFNRNMYSYLVPEQV